MITKLLAGALIIAGIIAAAIVIPSAIDDGDYEEPYAEFSADPLAGVEPLEVHFTDLSTGTVTFWNWDFNNDGIIDSIDQNPVYTYENPGEYTVSLKVGDITSSIKTKSSYISVSPIEILNIDVSRDEDLGDGDNFNPEGDDIEPIQPPEFNPVLADFIADPQTGNAPLQVQFTDRSTGDIIYREWDFDSDGIADSTEQNPVYIYDNAGIYRVSLLVRDNTSIAKTKIYNVTVLTPPQADFIGEPRYDVGFIRVRFTDMSTGNITYWKWDFDNDGKVDSTEQNPVHMYTSAGIYTVSLTVGNLTSSTVTKTDYIIVDEEVEVEENGGGGPMW